MPTCPRCRKVYPEDARVCGDDGEKLLPDEAFSNTERDLPAGYVVGEYRIETKLGEGGFGSVYRAVHPLIGKTAAIKVLNRQWSSNPQMVSRFIAEARAVNQIRHRNIIDIFSFGALDDGRQYYVMELLEGMTMDAFLAQHGRLPPADAIPILRQVARALDAAHAAGIAHRDLKPENVFLQMDDGAIFPKLLDFGIAKLLTDSSGGHKTRTGTPMGTPHYMSPEQCRGKDVDHRTDIYSFGVMVHKTLTGQLPFDGEEVLDILVKQTGTPAPRMSEVLPGLAPELDGPVLHMLEKDPAKRPPSLTVAVDELAACARVAVPTSGMSSPQVGGARSRGSGMTPAELGALVEARTVVGDVTPPQVSPTLLGSSVDTSAPADKKKTSPALLAGIVVAVLAVGGMMHIDARRRASGGEAWARFERRTSLIPFAAIARGEPRPTFRELGWWRFALGIGGWAVMLHLHPWLIGVSPMP